MRVRLILGFATIATMSEETMLIITVWVILTTYARIVMMNYSHRRSYAIVVIMLKILRFWLRTKSIVEQSIQLVLIALLTELVGDQSLSPARFQFSDSLQHTCHLKDRCAMHIHKEITQIANIRDGILAGILKDVRVMVFTLVGALKYISQLGGGAMQGLARDAQSRLGYHL
jgi:hypothetical protein